MTYESKKHLPAGKQAKIIQDNSYGLIPFRFREEKLEFLVIHQQKGHWAFPKGHGEASEDSLQAAEREFEEETGLKNYQVLEGQKFYEHYNFIENGQTYDKTVEYYLAEVGEGELEIQDEELQAAEWLLANEVLDKLTFPATKKVFKQALKHLKSGNHFLER